MPFTRPHYPKWLSHGCIQFSGGESKRESNPQSLAFPVPYSTDWATWLQREKYSYISVYDVYGFFSIGQGKDYSRDIFTEVEYNLMVMRALWSPRGLEHRPWFPWRPPGVCAGVYRERERDLGVWHNFPDGLTHRRRETEWGREMDKEGWLWMESWLGRRDVLSLSLSPFFSSLSLFLSSLRFFNYFILPLLPLRSLSSFHSERRCIYLINPPWISSHFTDSSHRSQTGPHKQQTTSKSIFFSHF